MFVEVLLVIVVMLGVGALLARHSARAAARREAELIDGSDLEVITGLDLPFDLARLRHVEVTTVLLHVRRAGRDDRFGVLGMDRAASQRQQVAIGLARIGADVPEVSFLPRLPMAKMMTRGDLATGDAEVDGRWVTVAADVPTAMEVLDRPGVREWLGSRGKRSSSPTVEITRGWLVIVRRMVDEDEVATVMDLADELARLLPAP